ncbi:MAK10-like protein [Tanacetum coccineum]|uniref:MAK10-like protein n=1 Tax=Tanacetum coccineum TaxID=301880 RepID=A0ABQ5HYW8_9ASTR
MASQDARLSKSEADFKQQKSEMANKIDTFLKAINDQMTRALPKVHIGRLKLLDDFYVIDMDKDPATPLLIGRGFLATTNAIIDYKKAKIAVGERATRLIFEVKDTGLGDEEDLRRRSFGVLRSFIWMILG